MKKKIQFVFYILFPIISIGQTQIGLKGGYNLYWFSIPDDNIEYDYDYSPCAYSIGLSINHNISRVFNPGIDVEYFNRSFTVFSKEIYPSGGETVTYDYTIGNLYLQIRPQFTFGSKVQIFLYPGFYFGTLLNSSIQGVTQSWGMSSSGSDTITGNAINYYPSFEFGIIGGAGVEIPCGKNICIIYENSFSINLLPVDKAWGSGKTKLLNFNFELGLAYTIGKVKSKHSD